MAHRWSGWISVAFVVAASRLFVRVAYVQRSVKYADRQKSTRRIMHLNITRARSRHINAVTLYSKPKQWRPNRCTGICPGIDISAIASSDSLQWNHRNTSSMSTGPCRSLSAHSQMNRRTHSAANREYYFTLFVCDFHFCLLSSHFLCRLCFFIEYMCVEWPFVMSPRAQLHHSCVPNANSCVAVCVCIEIVTVFISAYFNVWDVWCPRSADVCDFYTHHKTNFSD